MPSGRTALYFALATRRLVFAPGRHRGAAAPARSSGDAALLLAHGRVLRRSGVLVHRPSSTRSTGRSTGATSSAQLLLPPLFLHFALVFPDRPDAGCAAIRGRIDGAAPLPAGAASRRRTVTAILQGNRRGEVPDARPRHREVAQLLVSARSARRRTRDHDARAAHGALGHRAVVSCGGSCGAPALGSLPFVFGYAIPFALGLQPRTDFELTRCCSGLVPLAFASAIIRYRLMDVEVIIKRGLVYAAAIAAHRRHLRHRPRNRRQLVRHRAPTDEPGHRVPGDVRASSCVAAGEERDSDRPRPRLLSRSLRLSAGARRLRARPQQRSRSFPAERAPGAPRHGNPARRPDGADAGAGDGRTRCAVRHHRARRLRRRAAGAGSRL